MSNVVITLTTDFEEREPYVASVKGVLCSLAPGVPVVDLSHDIPREGAREAALFLAGAMPHFPAGTIHVVSVAAGPMPIAFAINGQFIICPDNGIVTLLAERHPIREARVIGNPTFYTPSDGQIYFCRDVFAPVAAILAGGGAFEELGEIIESPILLDLPQPETSSKKVSGQILHINRFGSLVTNIHESHLEDAAVKEIRIGSFPVGGLSPSYQSVGVGAPVALFGSAGYLEIAYNGGRADKMLQVAIGNRVDIDIEAAR